MNKTRKAEIKVYTADQIFAVAKLLENVYNLYPAITHDQKTIRSIAFDLEEKFSEKRKQLIKNHNLFEDKKTHKIKLKYHEEHALQRIIFDLIGAVDAGKPKFDLQNVHDYLHKRL